MQEGNEKAACGMDPGGPWRRSAPEVVVQCVNTQDGFPHYIVQAGCKMTVTHSLEEVSIWLKERVLDWTRELAKVGAAPKQSLVASALMERKL